MVESIFAANTTEGEANNVPLSVPIMEGKASERPASAPLQSQDQPLAAWVLHSGPGLGLGHLNQTVGEESI